MARHPPVDGPCEADGREFGWMGQQTVRGSRRTCGFVATVVATLTFVVSACSNGASPPTVALALPTDQLLGCTYTIDGQVQSYQATGETPNFAAFSPDPSAEAAIDSIKRKGGTGVVGSYQFPARTKLRSGPSLSAPVVGTISDTAQLQLYDPILWTDSSGDEWLASFIACGGKNLYWTSLDDLQKTDPAAAKTLRGELAQLRKAAPYTQTAMASLLPIVINSTRNVVWKDKVIPFDVGRAELVSRL
jgi:hypothetical protein